MAVTLSWRSRLAPFSFSLFFGSGFHAPPPGLQFEGVSEKLYCLGPVAAWAAGSSDTARIHSFIIRQMGWSRCGPCGRVPQQAPYHPTPPLDGTEGAGCSWVKRAPPPSTPSCPFLPPFPLLFCRSELSLVGRRGDSFVPKHTHKI